MLRPYIAMHLHFFFLSRFFSVVINYFIFLSIAENQGKISIWKSV